MIGMVTGSGSSAIVQRFSYDSSGNVVSVDYSADNGSTFITYYYLRNGQGDVVKLIDGSGNTVVQYTYDSWGQQLSCTGSLSTSLGANQPFRYRGYVYDSETGWYYLQSRYYDPSLGRFISSDVLLSTGQGVLGHNVYAYCGNNPVNRIDTCGTSWKELWEWLWSWLFPSSCGGQADPTPAPTATSTPVTLVVSVPDPTPSPLAATSAPSTEILECVGKARELIGKKTYKQMKCSNLVAECYSTILKADRVLAASQFDYVSNSSQWMVMYDTSMLREGDLIFYTDPSCNCGKRTNEIHHVAIYTGNGMMIDSTKSSLYGIDGVSERSINSILVNDDTGIQYEIFGFARYIG